MNEREWTMMGTAWALVIIKLKRRGFAKSKVERSIKLALAQGKIRSRGSPKVTERALVISNIMFCAGDVIGWMNAEYGVRVEMDELEPLHFAEGQLLQEGRVH